MKKLFSLFFVAFIMSGPVKADDILSPTNLERASVITRIVSSSLKGIWYPCTINNKCSLFPPSPYAQVAYACLDISSSLLRYYAAGGSTNSEAGNQLFWDITISTGLNLLSLLAVNYNGGTLSYYHNLNIFGSSIGTLYRALTSVTP